MAARRGRKTKRRRSPKTVSLWNLGVGWVYLTAFTKMATGYGPWQFVTGEGDLQARSLEDVMASEGWGR